MNEQPMKQASFYDPLTPEQEGDLTALEAMPEDAIDTSDIPEVQDWSDAVLGGVALARDVIRHKLVVGARLRQALDALDTTPAEVAHTLCIPSDQVGRWINGDCYPPYLAIEKLFVQYRITPGWLLCGDSNGMPEHLGAVLADSTDEPANA